jgi:CheY-like chemotaxis protein
MSEASEASILFVEDDPAFVADLLSLWHPAGPVRWAASAPEALARIAESIPRLILLDLCLPADEEEGLRLLSTIRESWGLDLPIVVVTRSDSAEIRARARRLGATAFVCKPVNLDEFDAAVQQALHAGGPWLN